jgi:hypothetical protein
MPWSNSIWYKMSILKLCLIVLVFNVCLTSLLLCLLHLVGCHRDDSMIIRYRWFLEPDRFLCVLTELLLS